VDWISACDDSWRHFGRRGPGPAVQTEMGRWLLKFLAFGLRSIMRSKARLSVLLCVFAAAWVSRGDPTAEEAAGTARSEPPAPTFDRQVNLVYTVNNMGFTDVCG
jgi:hypothetical protein